LDEGGGVWTLLDGSPDGSVNRVYLDGSVSGKDQGDQVGHVEDEVVSGVNYGVGDW
jgi:hypothetical protein